MIYLDNSATSLHKPKCVRNAMLSAMERCGNPGRGGHSAAMEAMETVYKSRVLAGELFDCKPEQVDYLQIYVAMLDRICHRLHYRNCPP